MRPVSRRGLCLAIFGMFAMSVAPLAGRGEAPPPRRPEPGVRPRVAPGFDRHPGSNPRQSRSAVVAKNGMACTSQPLASLVAIEVLKRGGTAADAAIAANAVLGVVEPMSCGIGGDLFVLYWHAKTKKLYGLNASGRSPHAWSREAALARGLSRLPVEGPLSWSVPGCVAGWEDLRQRFGVLPLAELLAPAIEHAEHGFAVSDIIAGSWQADAAKLARWPDSAATYLPAGRAPAEGDLFRNPNLARTYRLLAEQGASAFYRGDIARRLAAFSERHGGLLTERDLADHASDWVEPVSVNYRGYEVWELPPNGQGIAVLQMLNLLAGYDVESLGFGSPEYLHLFVEAKKLAYADRARYYADPEFASVPVAELLSPDYTAERRKKIDLAHSAQETQPGDPLLKHGDTVYLTVVDKDRNCCSFIESVYFGFGSKVVPGDLGFAMQNRGALFSLAADHPNRLEPHKRPFHTIIPALVTRDGQPCFCFGVMGGDFQPQGHVQALVNVLDFRMNVQEAADAARVRHEGGQSPTGEPMDADGGTVVVEPGISDGAVVELQKLGHRVVRAAGGYGGYQAIWIDWEKGTLAGGTDPRKDGCALGY